MSSGYITEVAMPAIVVDQNHDVINEADLIERASLASSEKEINPLKKSTSSSIADEKATSFCSDKICNSVATDNAENGEEAEQNVESPNAAKTEDDDSVFCEKSVDESSLIANTKLADDCVHSGYESTSSLKPSNKYDTSTTTIQQRDVLTTVADSSASSSGFIAPRNSVIDVLFESKAENISESDHRQMVKLDEEVRGSVITDDMSNDRDFCKLMNEVLTELQDCDVEEMIRLFVGSGIVEEGHLTGYVSPEQVIAHLRKYRFISRDNLNHLQNIIMRLDDSDLYFRCVQYLKHHHDIVFFYQELEEVPKGFGVVRCYIGGRDFTRLTREDVELTRYKVASMVFMPAQYFYIVGIEPGQRVVLSLMVLERYVDELYALAKDGLPELNLIGVEAIQIYNKTFSTAGRTAVDIYWGNRSFSYASVYRQLKEKCERVEEQDREIKDLREELEFLQLEVDTVGAEIDVLANSRGPGTQLFTGRRPRSRSSDNHSRARSMPPRAKVRDDGQRRYLTITSGLEIDLNKRFIAKQRATAERRGRLSDDRRELSLIESRLRYSPRSPRSSTERLSRRRFDDRDHLMNEIETLIDEITFVQSAV